MSDVALAAGRNLDEEVAETVMGWRREAGERSGRWRRPDGTVLTDLPKFSTDIAAAWQVVEKLGLEDVFLAIRLLPDGEYECTAQNEIGETLKLGDSGRVQAASAALAICVAAMLAGSAVPRPPLQRTDRPKV